jgi:hypothetical protein
MAKTRRHLVTHVFKGGRFDDHGLDVDCLPELIRYKQILVETAKALWWGKNPTAGRLPNNYEQSMTLKLTRIASGSVAVEIEREYVTADDTLPFDPPRDEMDEAVDLVADTVEAAGKNGHLPDRFPKRVLPHFAEYGKSLRSGEWIEHSPKARSSSVRFDARVRSRLAEFVSSVYEDAVDIVGTVTMARVNHPRMAITVDGEREVEAAFRQGDEGLITTALKDHSTAKLRVRGRGQYSPDGQLEKIIHVESVTLLPCGEIPYDPNAKPIWEVFEELTAELPQELLDRLPTDGAAQHNHYIYGTPKKPQ